MADNWRLEEHDGIATLWFDVPDAKVNTWGEAAMDEFVATLEHLAGRDGLRALVLRSGKPGTFIAGADIKELAKIEAVEDAHAKSRTGQRAFQALSALPFPTLAVIDGACLGGGLECALACTWRVAVDQPKTAIGLPEVQLGIIPGWGGCVRLPRLIGLPQALGMILPGKTVDARKAYRIGLVDGVIAAGFVDHEVPRFLERVLDRKSAAGLRARRTRVRGPWWQRALMATPLGRSLALRSARKSVMAKTRGRYPAPLAALEVLQRTATTPVEEALEAEAETFSHLPGTDVCRHLVELFFVNEELKRHGGDDHGRSAAIDCAGVLGAGVMGGGIAWLFARTGCSVRLKDVAWEAIAAGMRQAADYFRQLVDRRKLSRTEAANALLRIGGGLDLAPFRHTRFVVEAVVERPDVKRRVLAEVEDEVDDDCILATNTSSLRVADLAEALERPERFCGFHFFNPVNRMPLVEVVRGPRTAESTIATACAFARRCGKTAIVVDDCPGFLVNRILLPYLNEAARLFEEGAEVERVDRIATDFGLPMGPFRLADEVGLDVGVKVAHILAEGYGERMAVAPGLDRLVDEAGLLGRKGGAGFYRYRGKKTAVNPDALKLRAKGEHRDHGEDEILDRLVLTMVNEAARCMEEGVVAKAEHLDMAMIMGTGFPPYRGGLLRYAEVRGLKAVAERLTGLAEAHGARFTPAPLLDRLARNGGTFHGHRDLPTAA